MRGNGVDLTQNSDVKMRARKLERLSAAIVVAIALGCVSPVGSTETATPPIARNAIVSTHLVSAGYDRAAQILEIEFRSGAVYRYVAVPPEIFADLMKAESKGRYFERNIRTKFAFHRMPEKRP